MMHASETVVVFKNYWSLTQYINNLGFCPMLLVYAKDGRPIPGHSGLGELGPGLNGTIRTQCCLNVTVEVKGV